MGVNRGYGYQPREKEYVYIEKADLRNPDPNNWRIVKAEELNGHLIIELKYPNCTNYEGRKLMLYRGVTLVDLVNQKSVDPHFNNKKGYFSPVARFEPTDEGWKMARLIVKSSI